MMMKRDASGAIAAVEHRSLVVDEIRADDDDDRIIEFSLSSETPYRRWRGMEILVHSKDAVDLSFLNSGNAPLLFNHNPDAPIGVVQRAWLDGKRVKVSARFSSRQAARDVQVDVAEGTMRNVSVGYNVTEVKTIERGDDDAPRVYHVTKWKPMEASIVSVPADESVGFGRAAQYEQEGTMEPDEIETGAAPNGTNGVRSMPPVVSNPDDVSHQRAAEMSAAMDEINALAAVHNMRDVANSFISEAVRNGNVPSLAAFRGRLRLELPDEVPLVNNDVGLGEEERQTFSLVRLAASMVDNPTRDVIEAAAFEREACAAAAELFEGDTRGFRLPEELMRSWGDYRDPDGVTTDQVRAAMATSGNANVQDTQHLAGRFIENLRNVSSVLQAGVTTLTGLTGNIEIPGQDTNSAAGWLAAEGDDAPETVPTYRKVSMAINDLAGYTDFTRRMLIQSSIDVEMDARRQLLISMALGIDLAGLQGSGASGVPEGVKNTTGIGSVTFASLGAPTRPEVISMWDDVAQNNAAIGNLAFISNSTMVAHFMGTVVDAGSGRFMMDGPSSPLLATRHVMSNQVAANDLYYGNWSDLLLGMWGGLDLDRTTEGAVFLSGGVRIRAIQSVDFGVRRVGSFCLGNGGV